VMIAMRARLTLSGPNGNRVVPADRFITDPYTTALEEGEILTDITIEEFDRRVGGSYVKQKKNAGDFSVAAVATYLSFDASGTVKYAGIGMTSVSPIPKRAEKAEKFIVGKSLGDSVVEEACDLVVEESEPPDDFYGTSEYKKKVLWRVAKRSLLNSRQRAGVR
ncbi:MAG: FAD binding domain-containing protein, partial [Thermoplasmatales archaeon]